MRHNINLKNLNLTYQPVTMFEANAGILWCKKTNQSVFIDPAGDSKLFIDKTKELNLKPQAIWLTHGHIDHITAAPALKEEFNIKIIGPEIADKGFLLDIEKICLMYGEDPIKAFEPDQWLEDGDSLTLNESTFQVIHVPGHSPGSVAFYCKEEKFMLVGDVLFKGSIGRTDLPGSSFKDLQTSILEKLLPLGDDITIHPGHGKGTTLGAERLNNPFILEWKNNNNISAKPKSPR